ncbi:hypothetical protein BDFG_04016 [Blastomyces dermatitidis ATCC 26199]|nr:hypothetical protein BDFG_04016 [Blastomyces dermatitidis ATCC 26199]
MNIYLLKIRRKRRALTARWERLRDRSRAFSGPVVLFPATCHQPLFSNSNTADDVERNRSLHPPQIFCSPAAKDCSLRLLHRPSHARLFSHHAHPETKLASFSPVGLSSLHRVEGNWL